MICIANFPKIAQWDIALDRFSIIGGIFRAERNFSLSCDFSFTLGQNGGGGVVSTIFAWQPQTEKYVTRGDPNFLIPSYSFSKYLNLF